ncbi:hypothetical protein CALVIDRAFT_600566 [Calocera viscosa TUFC12733]|uniref:Geranylgeranyl pyrophosphate synthetase n=1 Tax=Calocera viscosa (strain TUFC12733) TaxID=1330018 RepID=A0A167JHD0_CALVF|nr:hypothetical protein CALVIDRAFT_600566 [Calocera viscosa TUFC12733]
MNGVDTASDRTCTTNAISTPAMYTYTNHRTRRSRGALRSRGGVHTSSVPSNQPSHADLVGDLSEELDSITIPTSDREVDGEIELTGFRTLVSFNWLHHAEKRTILIPGEPPTWCPPSAGFTVPPDSTPEYVERNHAQSVVWGTETILQCVKLLEPEFDLSSVDVVTSRHNLRKLLRFVMASAMEDYFRIDAEVVGETLILMRWQPAEIPITSVQFRGYGANFKRECTKLVRPDAPNNYRTVTYELGGLKFIVGSHVDGQLQVTSMEKMLSESANPEIASPKTTDPEHLFEVFTALPGSAPDTIMAFKDSTLHYAESGTLCPDSATMELHTRSGVRSFEYFDAYSQLFLSQTQYLVVGRHNRGKFTMPAEIRSLDDPFFDEQKPRLQAALKKLVAVLKEMKRIARDKGKGRPVAFVFEGSTLDVMSFNRRPLPDHIIKLFDKPIKA